MKSFRFPRQMRLLNAGDFRHVFESNIARASNRHFLILASKGQTDHHRIGFVIAKKHVRKAVDRNRIKRLIREYFRTHVPDIETLDIVVLARSGADKVENHAIHKQLDYLFGKLRSRCTNHFAS